jgi:hypothetical protein
MAPTRSGADSELEPLRDVPGVILDAAGNPIGSADELPDVEPVRPSRPSRPSRRPGALSRFLRGLGGRLLGGN